MKRIFTILIIGLMWVSMPTVSFCQDSIVGTGPDIAHALDVLLLDIDQLNNSIVNYEDIDLYDFEFQEAGNRLKSFAVYVTKDSPFYDTYDMCNHSFYQIEKRIESLKEEYSHKQSYDVLMERFQSSLQQLSDYKSMGEQYAVDGKADSLIIVKKKAGNVYRKASMEYAEQKNIVSNDETLEQLWDSIEDYNSSIEDLECSSKSKLYEMIFRIVMVVAVFLLVLNMLQSKIKANKMSKEAQKQMKSFMGDSESPTL